MTLNHVKAVYCSNDPGAMELRALDVKYVHIYRNQDGAHLYTYVMSRDECKT
jgi:hypothetical protein